MDAGTTIAEKSPGENHLSKVKVDTIGGALMQTANSAH